MNLSITITKERLLALKNWFSARDPERWILWSAVVLAIGATVYSYLHGYIIAYGDAESHLNIAKRVVDSLTPGFAQLGGIWSPLPHILMIPFMYSDLLWRSGLAGSIISGAAFVVSSLFSTNSCGALRQEEGRRLLGLLSS